MKVYKTDDSATILNVKGGATKKMVEVESILIFVIFFVIFFQKLVLNSLMCETPINICYNESPSRPTKFEKERQIVCYWLKQISPPIEPFCFDMPIKSIFEAQPEQLRKVIVKKNLPETDLVL